MTIQPSAKRRAAAQAAGPKPEWADGLRQLYNAVVEEPLPDCFRDLLAQLDQAGPALPDEPAAKGAGKAPTR